MPSSTVDARTLQEWLQDGQELALLDVREAGEFGEGHLLFATPLPYSRLELDIRAMVPRLTTRVVLCDSGESDVAQRAAKRLRALDYSHVRTLSGGTRAWAQAGHTLFAGVNVPSKLFGELVEHAYGTPRISVTDLVRMRESGEDVVVVDGRPFAEYQKMSIPGGICCPNAELPLRIRELVPDAQTKIVVNCAGRTRSILGAQTLINFGIENPVYALENGTQGWVLGDLELERGATRRYPEQVDRARLPALQAKAARLMERSGVETVEVSTVARWLDEVARTTYVIDVRTPEEYARGTLPGAVSAPGGQLIQATDAWVGVRNARIVLLDDENVRAPVVASWLRQLGWDAYVLKGGIGADLHVPPSEASLPPPLPEIRGDALHREMQAGNVAVIDLRASARFREQHIPGSRWTIRPRIANAAQNAKSIVLVSDDEGMARLAAIDVREAGVETVRQLEGGIDGWTSAGHSLQSSSDEPRDAERIDFLFFVHDRHEGNREAMKRYLAWETGLIAQLSPGDRSLFRVPAT